MNESTTASHSAQIATAQAVAIRPISPPPALLLFDLDDTLCDYAKARELRLRLAFSLDPGAADGDGARTDKLGRDLERMIADSLAVQPHGVDHFPELFRRHGVDDPAVPEAAMAWYRANRFHGLELFADAATTLAALRAGPAPGGGPRRIGLVTNGPAEVQQDKIELLGVGAMVDFVVVSGLFGVWKPDPAIFAEALRLGGAGADEAVFVGDSAEHDMAGARAAGIRSIWVNRTGRDWEGPEPAPDHEVRDLSSLVRLLNG